MMVFQDHLDIESLAPLAPSGFKIQQIRLTRMGEPALIMYIAFNEFSGSFDILW